MKKTIKILSLLIIVFPTLVTGNTQKNDNPQPVPEPKSFITKGSLFTGKTTLNYTTRASETYIKDEKGNPTASIFSIAYLKDGMQDPTQRPVTFVFNGGPGSSAVWLHMGILGPMRVSVPSDGSDDGAFTAAINDYLGRTLKVDFEREYKILSMEANMKWKRPASNNDFFSGFVNVMPSLANGVAENKDFRIFVAAGIYDLTTAFYSARYMFNQSGIPKERITLINYEGGHMMYTNDEAFKKMAMDLREFILAGNK